MAISMYQASVPVLVHALGNLKAILEKALVHAEAKKIDPAIFFGYCLFPDMLPLCRQVQIASAIAKICTALLSGQEPPKYDVSESSIPELIQTLDKAIAFINSFKADQIEGSEGKEIILTIHSDILTFKGLDYLQKYVIPNVYFHVATAYNILRHNGVELGKADYLGPIQ